MCIFPDRSAPGSPGESLPGPGSTTSHCPAVAGQSMVPRYISLLDGPPLELPVRRDLLSQAGRLILHPQPELWKAISAYQIPFGGMSLEKDPIVSRFPPWYFEAEVLQAFLSSSFHNADQERHNLLCPV